LNLLVEEYTPMRERKIRMRMRKGGWMRD